MKMLSFSFFAVLLFSTGALAVENRKPLPPSGGVKDRPEEHLLVPVLSLVWKTEGKTFREPESTYYAPEIGKIFVSSVDGAPDGRDGKGWVSVLNIDGRVENAKFIKGLNAPKGMRSLNGKLYISDLDALVVADLQTGKILSKIKLPGAQFANDVAIDPATGIVYVSDTLGSKIYQVEGEAVSEFMAGDELGSPNGLLVVGEELWVASWGKTTDWTTKVPGQIYALNIKSKVRREITKSPLGNLDGLERLANGDILTSDWAKGSVYRVSPAGFVVELGKGFKSSADLGFIPEKNWVIVPEMGANRVKVLALP